MTLSPATLRSYHYSIRKLQNAGQLDATNDVITSLNTTLPEYLEKQVANTGSRAVYVSAILHATKDWSDEIRQPYIDLAAKLRKTNSQEFLSQKLKDYRSNNMLHWNRVIALYDDAKATLEPQQFLIYCLYTLQAPVRADYANMLVLRNYSQAYKNDLTRNYCIVGKYKSYFVFNVYKTAKTYGQVIVDAHPTIHQMVSDIRSRTLLLPTITDKNMLSKHVIRIFEILANKKMGIGLLRHSFITTYLSVNHRITDKQLIARTMMHCWVTQEAYHIISDDE